MNDQRGKPSDTWWVISGANLVDLLQRAAAGEHPDQLLIEEYLDADREPPGDDTL